MTLMIFVHLIHWLTFTLFVSLILFGFRFRHTPNGRSLLIFCILAGWWALMAALIYLVPTLEAKILLNRLKMMGVFWIPLSVFYLAVSWHGHWQPSKLLLITLAALPLFFMILSATPFHETIISQYDYMFAGEDPSPLIFKNGEWYRYFNIYARLVILAALLLILHGSTQLNRNFRGQSYLIATCILIPFITDSIAVYFIQEMRYAQMTPTVLSISAFIIGLIVYRKKGLELIPMGHKWVVESFKDAYLLFDKFGHLVDFNSQSHNIFNVTSKDLGRPLKNIFSANKEIWEIFDQNKDCPESELELLWQDTFYLTNLKQLQNKNDKFMGWLFVFSDITRLKLIEANLLELNEMKSKFLGIMAHDLVGHVRALSLTSQVLRDGYQSMTSESVRDVSDLIYQSSEAMNQFIQELLSWSKAQIHSFVIQKTTFLAKDWVNNVFNFIEPLAKAKNIKLEKIVPENFYLYGDPNMLSTVLRNLVENGIKNSPKDGLLKVSVERKEGETIISVTNQGKEFVESGVDSDIFKLGKLSFQHSSRQGLGLYLCKDFISRHNGKIWASPLPNKQGVTFCFSLPDN